MVAILWENPATSGSRDQFLGQEVAGQRITVFNMASPEGDLVQFAPFSSAVDVAFWHKLKENKLEIYQLDDKPKPLQANYTNSKL